jgi:hypothetical protein
MPQKTTLPNHSKVENPAASTQEINISPTGSRKLALDSLQAIANSKFVTTELNIFYLLHKSQPKKST